MTNLFNVSIESLSIHRVGNKSRNEGKFLSKQPHPISNEVEPLLKEFFFKPFRDKDDTFYKFYHDVHLDYHDMRNYVAEIFKNPDNIHEYSEKIATHLFEQSLHPHIKAGEVYVAYITNITIDNTPVDAIGIFKSEIKDDFIQFEKTDTRLNMILQQGINLAKIDKGCLIFNYKADEGYKVLSIDNNRYDARYWLDHFLSVEEFIDESYLTKKYLKFCQDFAKEVVLPAEDKKEEVLFMNRAVNFFAKNDEFDEQEFIKEVIDNPDLAPEFKNYKLEKAGKYNIEDITSFPISNEAVHQAQKKCKGTISLDTNITIHLDFINPESMEQFVEKGWDEEKQMYYYLVYFNKENKK